MQFDKDGKPLPEEEVDGVEEVDEDVDDAEDDVDDVDTEEEAESSEDDVEDEEAEVKFDVHQQKKVNDIVQKRLLRNDEKIAKELESVAGTELNVKGGEHLEAIKLWGFMKLNPELSGQIQGLIDTYIGKGNYVQPDSKQPTREQALELKEARLDLKASDRLYAKNEKNILDWAEENDIDVTNAKTLKLAYKAWKGENLNVQKANEQLKEQRKTQKKTNRRSAVLEGGKGRKSATPDYSKMSERDILHADGLSLFTED
jgi:hypothetical protein